jgi:hypothetical protein
MEAMKYYVPIVDGVRGGRFRTEAEAIQHLITMVRLHPFNDGGSGDLLEFPFDCAIIRERAKE